MNDQPCTDLARKIDRETSIISRNLYVVSMCSSGKRNLARVEGLLRQPHHDRRVLADGIEHHRPGGFRDNFAENMNALGFEGPKVR